MYISEIGGRSVAAQEGNRFVSFVRARAAGYRVGVSIQMSVSRLSLFPFGFSSLPPSQHPVQLQLALSVLCICVCILLNLHMMFISPPLSM